MRTTRPGVETPERVAKHYFPHQQERPLEQQALLLVGEGGFGPPKSETTDLQSAPFGHSGIPPYSVGSHRNNRIIADAAGIVKMFFKNVLELRLPKKKEPPIRALS